MIEYSLVSAHRIAGKGAEANSPVAQDFPLQFQCSKEAAMVRNGNFQMRLNGPVGAAVVVESSPALVHWMPI